MSYQLYHGDCLDLLPTLPDKSVDAVIADPPYGATACKWDSVIPFEPMWAELRRVIKPRGAIVLFGSQPFTSALVMSNPKWFRHSLIWDKKNSNGYLNAKKQPMRRHEDIVVFGVVFGIESPRYYPIMRKGVLRLKGGMKNPSHVWRKHESTKSYNDDYYPTSVIEISNANRSEKVHSTQKPVALIEYLVKTYTHEGDAGYFAIAAQRIEAAYNPLGTMEQAS